MSVWTHLTPLEGSSLSLMFPLMSKQHRECCRKIETRSLQMFSLLVLFLLLNYFWLWGRPSSFWFLFPSACITNFFVGFFFFLQIKTWSFDCNFHFSTVNPTLIVQDCEIHKSKLHINMNHSFWSDIMPSSGKSSSRIFLTVKECLHRQDGIIWRSLSFFFSHQIQTPWVR